jgi:hypothetical protein
MVEINTADGFNIPYAVKDLLIVDDQGVASRFFDEDFGNHKASRDEEPIENLNQVSTELFKRQSAELDSGFYLAYVPHDQKWLLTGPIDLFLLNNTDYDIIFSFSIKAEESYENQEYDIIEPHNKYLISTFDREEINQWLESHIQLLFVKSSLKKIIAPLNKSITLKGNKFYQEGNFNHVDILDQNAMIVEIVKMDYQEMISKNNEFGKDEPIPEEPKAKIKKQKTLIQQHKTGSLEAEVDLHISALVDDYRYMKPLK